MLLGISNFLGALLIAGTFDIPEVALSEIYSRDAAEMQPRCSRGVAEVQSRCTCACVYECASYRLRADTTCTLAEIGTIT